jgi:hypothetical protein
MQQGEVERHQGGLGQAALGDELAAHAVQQVERLLPGAQADADLPLQPLGAELLLGAGLQRVEPPGLLAHPARPAQVAEIGQRERQGEPGTDRQPQSRRRGQRLRRREPGLAQRTERPSGVPLLDVEQARQGQAGPLLRQGSVLLEDPRRVEQQRQSLVGPPLLPAQDGERPAIEGPVARAGRAGQEVGGVGEGDLRVRLAAEEPAGVAGQAVGARHEDGDQGAVLVRPVELHGEAGRHQGQRLGPLGVRELRVAALLQQQLHEGRLVEAGLP